MNANNMAKPLDITLILDYMKFILEKSPMNVNSVAKSLGVTAILNCTKDFILERTPMIVSNVIEPS